MNVIGIFGAGWLGKALAKSFSETHAVCLSQNRSIVSIPQVQPFPYSYPQLLPPAFALDTLVFCLPPSVLQSGETFRSMLQSISANTQVIYTSSTGVYEACEGRVTEYTEIEAKTARTTLLLDLEQAVLDRFPNSCVLRLAGLVGPERNPKNFFQNKDVIPGAEDAVNLVHQQDVVRFCQMATERKWRGIFNVVAPYHPSKGYFYASLKKDLSIATAKTPTENARIVESARAEQEEFEYQYAELLEHFSQVD